MKRLHVLRHAKSSWRVAELADHDRPLTTRGMRAATRLAGRLEETDIRPQLVICSSAVRARATLAAVAPALGSPELVFEAALYHASADALLRRVALVDDAIDELMLVGHNPGFQDLCLRLATPSPERDRIAAKFPTGAFVTLGFRVGEWGLIGDAQGEVLQLMMPRDDRGTLSPPRSEA